MSADQSPKLRQIRESGRPALGRPETLALLAGLLGRFARRAKERHPDPRRAFVADNRDAPPR